MIHNIIIRGCTRCSFVCKYCMAMGGRGAYMHFGPMFLVKYLSKGHCDPLFKYLRVKQLKLGATTLKYPIDII